MNLGYLERAADTIARLQREGAHEEAGRLLEGTLDAIDRELVERGNVAGEPAIFETLLLQAQLARESEAVKEEVTHADR